MPSGVRCNKPLGIGLLIESHTTLPSSILACMFTRLQLLIQLAVKQSIPLMLEILASLYGLTVGKMTSDIDSGYRRNEKIIVWSR